jgi:hypothetical protein
MSDHVDVILDAFNRCSPATGDLVYFPVSQIGRVIHAALSARMEIRRLEGRIKDLQQEVEKARS